MKTLTTPRARFIEHRGHSLLFLDYSGLRDPNEVRAVIDDVKALVTAWPADRPLLTLSYVRGARLNHPATVAALRAAVEHNPPFVRHGAVVGISREQRVVYEGIMLFSGRKLRSFDDLGQAMDWLVTQTEDDT